MIKSDQPTIFDAEKLNAVVSSKADGNVKSAGAEDLAETTGNVRRIAESAGLNFDHIVTMNVGAHADAWDEIVDVSETPDHALIAIEDRVVSDALTTNNPDVVLMLPVADCNAVAVHDPAHGALALVHLGWQSTAAELAGKIVAHMQQKYQSDPADLRVYLSPAIKAESYVFDKVSQDSDPDWQPFLHRTERGVGIDLPGYNRHRFTQAGVKAENIEVCPVNTATSDDYYSHYRAVRTGEPDGRFGLLVGLKK